MYYFQDIKSKSLMSDLPLQNWLFNVHLPSVVQFEDIKNLIFATLNGMEISTKKCLHFNVFFVAILICFCCNFNVFIWRNFYVLFVAIFMCFCRHFNVFLSQFCFKGCSKGVPETEGSDVDHRVQPPRCKVAAAGKKWFNYPAQGCQMVYFKSKFLIWVNFGASCSRRC
jgi:hypothetical protein